MIDLGNPWGLLAALSVPVLLLLHSLRPRRRTVIVSTSAFWQAAHRDRQRGLGLRRLPRSWSLLLLLGFAALASLGLADPRWVTGGAGAGDVVVVIDVSASMQARAGEATRLVLAKARVTKLIDGLPDGARLLLMTSGREPRLRSTFEDDRDLLHSRLEAIAPTDEAGRPREAVTLALSLVRNRPGARVIFLTDGAFDEPLVIEDAPVEFERFGGEARNVAITRFDVRREIGTEERFEVLVAVRNYTDSERMVPLSVTVGRTTISRQSLQLGPGEARTVVLPHTGRLRGRAGAAIEVEDDLAADDRAFAWVGDEGVRYVLLVSPGSFYLESVLEAMPGVVVTRIDAVDAETLPRQAELHDVVVLDRVVAPALPVGRYLLVDTLPPGLPFTDAGTVERPAVTGVGASALMRHVDARSLRVDRARRIEVVARPPGLQRLFWSEETDLGLALIDDRVRLVYLGFDLTRSSLPRSASFPLFASQTLEWLRPRGTDAGRGHVDTGEPVTLYLPGQGASVIARSPSGDAQVLVPSGDRLRFDATSRAGIYRFSVAGVERHVAVNLADARESDPRPRARLVSRADRGGPAGAEGQLSLPVWPPLIVLAMALLAIEWWLRTTGRVDA